MTGESKQERKFEISESLATTIFAFLQELPYKQVAKMVEGLSGIKPIVESKDYEEK